MERLHGLEVRREAQAERLSAVPADLPEIQSNVADTCPSGVMRIAVAPDHPETGDKTIMPQLTMASLSYENACVSSCERAASANGRDGHQG